MILCKCLAVAAGPFCSIVKKRPLSPRLSVQSSAGSDCLQLNGTVSGCFFGKASFETEHYIRPPGSNNRFHEMLACRSCCVPLSHVYVCVTEGAAFQLFARSLSECPGSMFELCRAWNSNRTEEHAGPTNFS